MAQLLPPDLAALGRIKAFQGLPPPVLAWLQQAGELWQYAPGETVVHPNEHTDRMLAVVTGGIQYDGPAGEQFTHLVRLNAGCLGGALPYARFQHSAGLGVAVGETVVYVLLCSLFPALEQVSPELVQRLVGVLSDRARDEVRAQERDDKLRALVKLSAGLSHELNDVKIYSHMDRATGPEKLAVTSGLDSTLHMFAHALRQKNVVLTRDYAPGLPLIMGQAGSLNQVWTNLLDNALDALPTSGGELRVRVSQAGNFLCVSIEDNGAGITPEVLAHMFEPFYTTKAVGKGSGHGLDIARHIVQEHNGRLEATSEPGRTEFRVFLPIGYLSLRAQPSNRIKTSRSGAIASLRSQ